MALINNNYVWIASEELSSETAISEHPVESGEPIADHSQKQPTMLSISGKIVDNGGKKAADIVAAIEKLQKNGSLITYVGRNTLSNMLIQDFGKSYTNTTWGGCEFTMTLKEVRIAKAAFIASSSKKSTNTGTQQVKKSSQTAVYHPVKKGECVWNLITEKYKTLTRSGAGTSTMSHCEWVMSKNPSAFSRKGDFRTLQLGKKLLMGYRE